MNYDNSFITHLSFMENFEFPLNHQLVAFRCYHLFLIFPLLVLIVVDFLRQCLRASDSMQHGSTIWLEFLIGISSRNMKQEEPQQRQSVRL